MIKTIITVVIINKCSNLEDSNHYRQMSTQYRTTSTDSKDDQETISTMG